MKTTWFVALVLALPLRADTLADVRIAVSALHGAQPIRATVELRRSDDENGRFSNDRFNGAASVDVALDAEGVHVRFAPALVEQIVREQREHAADAKKIDTTARTAGHVGPLWVLEHLNAADTFLGMLRHAKLQSETRSSWQSHPARLLTFHVEEPEPDGMKGLGSVGVKERQLKVWIGDDNVPLAAERSQEATPRVLFFHGTVKSHDTWSFAHVNDHLVIVRHDSSHDADMLGQKSSGQCANVRRSG